MLVPLFIVGSFLVELLQEYLPPDRVEPILRRYDGGSGNVVAAGIGAITPFCSVSTVPVVAGLLGAGAPLGIAFSFLLASPLVNELAIVLLIGIFGVKVTALYVLLTGVAAITGGIVIGKLDLEHRVKDSQFLTSDEPDVVADGGGSSPSCDADAAPQLGADCGLDAGCDKDLTDNTACTSPNRPTTHRARVKRAARGGKGSTSVFSCILFSA